MPTITYHVSDGTTKSVTAPEGQSVMRAAVMGGIRGIVGECGGQAMCATCHVYVRDAAQRAGLPPLSADEDEMLDCTAAPREGESRLGCQLIAGVHFDELSVWLPDTQI